MQMKHPKILRHNEKNEQVQMQEVKTDNREFGVGLDVGTMNIACAILENTDEIKIRTQRDAFFDIENDKFARSMLTSNNAPYLISDDQKLLYVIGQEAVNFANIFKREIRRPLQKGVISTREPEALLMIKTIITNVLGKPKQPNEICRFSVPAAPIDADYNIIYHENVLKSFIEGSGFKAEPVNEAKAICFSELDEENFTGLAISFGAGMVNVALVYMGTSCIEFSVSRSGDWIDDNAARAIGERSTKMIAVKEAGLDLLAPKDRYQESISIFYRNFIAYVVKCFESKLAQTANVPEFPQPISIVLAGGSSLAGSFDKVFKQEIEKIKMPFNIKEIRLAQDQMFAVAKGCLFSSLSEYDQG